MIVDGKKLAQEVIAELQGKATGETVCFVSFLHSPESKSFIRIKTKVAEQLGIKAETVFLDAENTEQAIQKLSEVTAKPYQGIVVQLPLPGSFDSQRVLDAVPLLPDIDVLSTEAKQLYAQGQLVRVPPVAWAVSHILHVNNIDLQQKNIVVLGKGKLVGEPVTAMLDRKKISYKAIDITTDEQEKRQLLLNADVIISGIGMAHYLKPEMIKDGVVLIDAGTSEDFGELKGDIDPACADKASFYTPVPGGVGPLTVVGLYKNLLTK